MEKDKTENHRGKYMNLLTMEHVSKAYTDRVLLDDVGFGINKNEKIGVIGVNGMGKSTLPESKKVMPERSAWGIR